MLVIVINWLFRPYYFGPHNPGIVTAVAERARVSRCAEANNSDLRRKGGKKKAKRRDRVSE